MEDKLLSKKLYHLKIGFLQAVYEDAFNMTYFNMHAIGIYQKNALAYCECVIMVDKEFNIKSDKALVRARNTLRIYAPSLKEAHTKGEKVMKYLEEIK